MLIYLLSHACVNELINLIHMENAVVFTCHLCVFYIKFSTLNFPYIFVK